MSKPETLLRQLYGSGKPWLFVVMAVRIASSASDVREMLRWVTGRARPPRSLPAPLPLREWLAIYRDHRSMSDGLGEAFGLSSEIGGSELLGALGSSSPSSSEDRAAAIKTLSPAEQEAFVRAFVGVPFPPDERTLRRILEALESEATDTDQSDDALMRSPSGVFFFRVWLPCWVLYRTYPINLLRDARHGNNAAFEKLLRIDKSIVADPCLARRWHLMMHTGSLSTRRSLLDAMKGRPKSRLTEKSIRLGLAGLISQFALGFRWPVASTDIEVLFHRIARVRGRGADDRALPTGWALTKGIQRNRTWPSLPRRGAARRQ